MDQRGPPRRVHHADQVEVVEIEQQGSASKRVVKRGSSSSDGAKEGLGPPPAPLAGPRGSPPVANATAAVAAHPDAAVAAQPDMEQPESYDWKKLAAQSREARTAMRTQQLQQQQQQQQQRLQHPIPIRAHTSVQRDLDMPWSQQQQTSGQRERPGRYVGVWGHRCWVWEDEAGCAGAAPLESQEAWSAPRPVD